MDAEQVRPAKVPANMFGGESKMLIFLFWLEYSCGKKAGGSETWASL